MEGSGEQPSVHDGHERRGIASSPRVRLLALLSAIFIASFVWAPQGLAEPVEWIDITPEAVQTFYQTGVPSLPGGQRFFPNGLYFVTGGNEDQDAIATLHEAGFTVALGSGRWDPSVYVDAAEGTNVHIIIDQSQHAHGYASPPIFDETWFKRYRDDPAVLGWLLYDEALGITKFVCAFDPDCTEPDLSLLSQIGQIYDSHKLQTDQLLFIDEMALVDHPNWGEVLTLTDAAVHYWYPKYFPGNKDSLEPMAESMALQTQIVAEARPSWFVPQAFCCDLFTARFPTPQKARAQAYTAIIHGATGLLHFAWDSELARNLVGQDSGVVGIRPDTPARYASGIAVSAKQVEQSKRIWAAMDTRSGPSSLNRQILALTEVLLSPTSSEQYEVAVDATPLSSAPVRTLLKEYEGSLYLLAVNINGVEVNARFTFDQPYRIRPLFADSPLLEPYVGQELVETFQPFATRVYRLSSCLDPNADGKVNTQDIKDIVSAIGAEAGFSPQYDIDWDYSGNGVIDWQDVQIFIDDSAAPLPGCLPCQDSDGDGISDCQAYFRTFLRPHPVVVLSDRMVCSLLGEHKMAVGIRGQDTGGTVEVDDVVYWTFGDTLLADRRMIPNVVGWSSDGDASDCISLTPKEEGGRAVPLLARDPGSELTVWPLGMEATAPGQVHVYYDSVVADPVQSWRVAGVGLASFDADTLTAERALGGAFLWGEETGLPATGVRTVADDSYIYLFLVTSSEPQTTDTILARVPKESIESPASYEYWDPGGPGESGNWVGDLWNRRTRSWGPGIADIDPLWGQTGLHNGIEVAYNEFLGRWLAVYTTGFMTSVNVRAADELTGPWDDRETVLVDCSTFHPPPHSGFVCYSGAQHEFYTQDGGRTIYVSYSNGDTYQVYVHEIRLAAPVTQWSDTQGRAVYLPGDAQGPDGFSPDGLTFYASDIPVPGFAPIHRWEHLDSGDIQYGAAPPDPPQDYQDMGVDFYAPVDAAAAEATNALYAPVYRWSRGKAGRYSRYSPLNLGPAGYVQQDVAFYAACPDGDGDTLTDCRETFLETDPSSADTDGDGLNDGYERTTQECDPLVYNDDLDGVAGPAEILGGTNPCVWDTGAIGCTNGEWHHPDCDVDSDGDSCPDAWELGPDPRLGGQRDPHNPWDFYDPPGNNNVRDKKVNLFDILAVVMRFGARDGNGNAPINRASDPLSAPPPAPAYHPAFDRSLPPPGADPWDLGPPDGRINLLDILGLVNQYGHTCRGPGT